MQRPVHSSYGRVKQKWTGVYLPGRVTIFFLNSSVSRSSVRMSAQSALHVMLL